LDFKQRSRLENPTIVFSVGFEYSDPATAARVANELMTRILSEDLRDRRSRATDTTKFLAREVQRLEADNAALDTRIAQLRLSQNKPASAGTDQPATVLGQLKSELVQKSALYSDRHPFIQSLKRQIEAMEKAVIPPVNAESGASASLEALVAQQEALQTNLDAASTKLAAARLGENLEKDQQSEKLEIIEQPTIPQQPIKPNRPKVAALAVLLAFMAGAGLAFVVEISDKGIRRSSDIFSIVDSQLIVSIPYIVTAAEVRRRKRRIIVFILGSVLLLIGVLTGAYLFLPPLDLMIAKARVGLFR
jgi:capsule polysaccharide export protein KpsE/RkpR